MSSGTGSSTPEISLSSSDVDSTGESAPESTISYNLNEKAEPEEDLTIWFVVVGAILAVLALAFVAMIYFSKKNKDK